MPMVKAVERARRPARSSPELDVRMLRLGLVTYLGFATLAGPWLCCCTWQRVSSQLMSAVQGHATGREHGVSGCCHHRGASHDHRHANDSACSQTKEHTPDKHPHCPCQERHEPSLYQAPEGDEFGIVLSGHKNSVELSLPPALLADRLYAPAAVRATESGPGSSGRFATARDLLRALHVWLC